MANIVPPKAPNLLQPPKVYDPQYMQQQNAALTLYFAKVDNAAAQLILDASDLQVLEWLDS